MEKKIIINGTEHCIHLISKSAEKIVFELNGKEYTTTLQNEAEGIQYLECNGKNHKARTEKFHKDGTLQVFVDDLEGYINLPGKVRAAKQSGVSEGSLKSPMPGKVFKVLKEEGQDVKAGEIILILEAMKMEHTIKAHNDGVVKKIYFKEGDQVQADAQLCEIE